jgi:hypothetical protein
MTTFEIVQTVANIAIALTFAIAAWQLWETKQQANKAAIQKRSEYVISLYNAFINDKDMVDIYYKLEYSEFKYDNNFHGSDTEKKLDKLLGHFSNIGRLNHLGILTIGDLKFMEYEFLVMWQNKNIKSYLQFLDEWFKLREIKDTKFEYFRLTGQLLEQANKKRIELTK